MQFEGAIWKYTVEVYADPLGQCQAPELQIRQYRSGSFNDLLHEFHVNVNVGIIKLILVVPCMVLFARILWCVCVLLKEENFFATVRSRPKRPSVEVPRQPEPTIGADEAGWVEKRSRLRAGWGCHETVKLDVVCFGELPGPLQGHKSYSIWQYASIIFNLVSLIMSPLGRRKGLEKRQEKVVITTAGLHPLTQK